MLYFDETINKTLDELKTTKQGLSTNDFLTRLKEHGPNTLEEEKKTGALKIFISQFKSPLVGVLLLAMIVSFLLKENTSFYTIGAIVILNATLGFVQEYRAEAAIESLKKLIALKAKVMRDGKGQEVPAEELVPGDIMLIETGDKIAADARIIECKNFQTNESSLTGESTSVRKQDAPLPSHTTVADRTNIVFFGTIVTAGRAMAVVTDTGMHTEIGRIAKMIRDVEIPLTPLQKKLSSLGTLLLIIIITIALIIFLIGVINGKGTTEMLLAAIAIAVAAIPEGLPAVITTSLALGVKKMAQKHALIRRLPCVETLGACNVICTDKTGTITVNQMTVKKIYANQEIIGVTGTGYSINGKFEHDPKKFEKLLEIGAINNNAKIGEKVIGDPTEAALLVSAKKAGIDYERLQEKYPRVEEIEFTSERKCMSTIHKFAEKDVIYSKGAPEVILSKCNKILLNGRVVNMTHEMKSQALDANDKLTKQALRVLAFAYGDKPVEKEMIFVGYQAMIDPPREEVRTAINKCKTAGIRVIMITGDHMNTAIAIAQQLGIIGKAITGDTLEKITNLEDMIDEIAIYARVNPAHKLKIVDALKKKGNIVAMTGDGVNDAPALKKADLGIAMGIGGTDVAREASAMILADDNFSTIVNAVQEGRKIFDNIRKFIEYLISSNIGAVSTVFFSMITPITGGQLPINPLMILWMNLVTDGAPALALGMEPEEEGIMLRKPRKVDENIINKKIFINMLLIGIVMAPITLLVFQLSTDLKTAQTMAFSTLVILQLFNVFNMRSEEKSAMHRLFTNKWLWLSLTASIAMQLIVVTIPFFQNIFGTVALSLTQWVIVLGASSLIVVFAEALKLFKKF